MKIANRSREQEHRDTGTWPYQLGYMGVLLLLLWAVYSYFTRGSACFLLFSLISAIISCMTPIMHRGPAPEKADATLILVHGRGATAEGMLDVYDQLDLPRVAAVAPQAPKRTWYPHSFLAPVEKNQPHLDRTLERIDTLVEDLIKRGIPLARIAFLGFSQGACVLSEYVALHPRRYAGIMALTGALIRIPSEEHQARGSLDGTPVFLGANDPDSHVPFDRVQATAKVLTRMHANVDVRRYPDMPHTINDDELEACRTLLADVEGAAT